MTGSRGALPGTRAGRGLCWTLGLLGLVSMTVACSTGGQPAAPTAAAPHPARTHAGDPHTGHPRASRTRASRAPRSRAPASHSVPEISHLDGAVLVGATGLPTTAGWLSDQRTLGSPRLQRIFYPHALPASYPGSYCAALPASVTCIISYKMPTVNVASYVQSVPPRRQVIFIFHHEPENDSFPGPGSTGQNFVAEFDAQSRLIRAAAGGSAAIKVAMAAETWQYQPGTGWNRGADCAFIPAARYVNYYLADIYEPDPDGRALPDSPVAVQWNTWLGCVTAAIRADPGSRTRLGIAEYGLGTLDGDRMREKTLAADAAYLAADVPRFSLWEYWWQDDSVDGGCTPALCDWQFTDPATIREWRAIQQELPLTR